MTWNDVRELLQLAFGFWAFWVFAFGVVFIVVFRSSIAALIGRVRRIEYGPWTAKVDAAVQQQDQDPQARSLNEARTQASHKKSDPRAAADEILHGIEKNKWVADLEVQLKTELTQRGLTSGEPETYRVLVALVAWVGSTIEFERLYNTIWTSQIEILQKANEGPVSEEEARKKYTRAVESNPAAYAKYGFESYMRFLTEQNLLTEPTSGQQYQITDEGRTFLLFMINTGKPLRRPSVY